MCLSDGVIASTAVVTSYRRDECAARLCQPRESQRTNATVIPKGHSGMYDLRTRVTFLRSRIHVHKQRERDRERERKSSWFVAKSHEDEEEEEEEEDRG